MTGRALITGAGDRLGRAMALHLGAQGFDVAVHYNSSSDGARETAEEIIAQGGKSVTLGANLLDEEATQALLPRAREALGGPITCLVNNASIFEEDSIETGTRESWDRHLESNLRAPVVLTQHLAADAPDPDTDDRGEPVARALVVNMLDQRVRKLTPAFMSYTIAKMGLWTFTRTAAQALAPRVRVNAIGPGPTLRGTRQSEKHFQDQRDATILERGSNPEDICAALQYFVDARAVTGQLLCVDGGQHLAWQTPDVLGPE
ncbi:SDR family oxidoreductase [Ovoidimarina sediminis]|uniref:SDR family oxidoreductase n=1 Tax=Ovoidimarina sediminis TaxID=3079856 RepID=UPI00290D0F32|nr:SDR family oxidoreductase [Rhodophyticola sp. MJ-SS7]MDU8944029.1 SDR family oxidoreductase [Rhodophyticola sp. MJ-SS7]